MRFDKLPKDETGWLKKCQKIDQELLFFCIRKSFSHQHCSSFMNKTCISSVAKLFKLYKLAFRNYMNLLEEIQASDNSYFRNTLENHYWLFAKTLIWKCWHYQLEKEFTVKKTVLDKLGGYSSKNFIDNLIICC